ncbi:esterase [Shimwellia pseudoproteus]|uniref:esterase n=1 Tax=Shimwellia pseudoproteus TaxID=570012 RepID=UPI0018EAEFDF|nr:esterase [Shimwellia pseudoproteus]MBJ3814081.1 esterase [Shimwellia pseudoproteus]
MIEVFTEHYADTAVLHACPAGMRTTPLPTVVFYHGFSSSKTVYSYCAVALAMAGIRVIMPDAAEHGDRYYGDNTGRLTHFWHILYQNLVEYPRLRDAILATGQVLPGALGVGGASMGGMTALGIMARHPEVACAASLMGSGFYAPLARTLFPPLPLTSREAEATFGQIMAPLADYEASVNLRTLSDRPLFLWHGLDDDVVPAADSLRLQHQLLEQGGAALLTCQWQAGVRHRVTPEALEATVRFFAQHLPGA